MLKSRVFHILFCLSMVVTLVGGLAIPAFAEDPAPATLSLNSKYPSVSANSGEVFTYDVSIVYNGTERKTFTVDVTTPQGWSAYTSAGYPEKEITSLQIDPGSYGSATESVKLYLGPNYGLYPDPGNYNVTLKVSSGADLVASITLEAKVKAKYALSLTTDSGNLATTATAGKENSFSFKMINLGTATIDELKLSSTAPSGWTITFQPETVDSINAGQTQQINATITPPEGKTVAGDYMITLKADNGKNTATMDVRVTVETPTIWGWVAFLIIVLVILALLVLFWKMGRR
jgi:uncharacterized membrane protein